MIPFAIALMAWIPIVLVMFASLAPRRAAIYSVLIGMLFLPEAKAITLPLMAFDKLAAISTATLLGILIFDGAALTRFRFAWYDGFCVVLCVSPMFTSLSNDLGAKDGVSEVASMVMTWGIPYLIGRLYLTDLDGLRDAAIAIVQGGVVYAGLCFVEIVLSPQLHRWVYGYHQHSFAQTIRFGGYRPMVFLEHGLAVGTFMASASICALALWRYGAVRSIFWLPMSLVVAGLFFMTVMCKSSGSVVLLIGGVATLLASCRLRSAIPLMILIALPLLYMVTRTLGVFDGTMLVSIANDLINEDRAQSLEYRMRMETAVVDRALEQPALGWGGWNRSRAVGDNDRQMAVTDGLWIIAMGQRGLIGLVALYGTFLVGPLLLGGRYRPDTWRHPAVAPAFACAIVVVIHMIDNIPNGMPSPVVYFLGGGLAGLLRYQPNWAPAAQPQFAAMSGTVHGGVRPTATANPAYFSRY